MASYSYDTNRLGVTPRLLLGFGLALLGVVLLLGELDILDARSVLRFWPVILIAIGLQQFFNPRIDASGEKHVPVSGIVWMAIGGILLLNSFEIVHVSLWDLFWPAVLIALGVRLMTGRGLRGIANGPRSAAEFTSSDTGPIFAVMGGVKRVSAQQPFSGAEVTAFMGGAMLDLRQAILKPGEEGVIDIFAVMGGCELLIPPQWVVSAPIVAIMGGIEDKRLAPVPAVVVDATASAAGPARLVIRGLVMMGGVTIRS